MTDRVTTLDQLHLAFAERFNARDIEGLLALNAPDAIFVPAPGQPVQGAEAVQDALEQYLSLGLPISMNVRHVFVAGSVGLAIADWKIAGTGPDGSAVELTGSTSDVAVHDDAWGWRFAVDNPFGTV